MAPACLTTGGGMAAVPVVERAEVAIGRVDDAVAITLDVR
jgi:hypothetical protein